MLRRRRYQNAVPPPATTTHATTIDAIRPAFVPPDDLLAAASDTLGEATAVDDGSAVGEFDVTGDIGLLALLRAAFGASAGGVARGGVANDDGGSARNSVDFAVPVLHGTPPPCTSVHVVWVTFNTAAGYVEL